MEHALFDVVLYRAGVGIEPLVLPHMNNLPDTTMCQDQEDLDLATTLREQYYQNFVQSIDLINMEPFLTRIPIYLEATY